jgi:glycosyltransferase involved in cell wall biosynthesis
VADTLNVAWVVPGGVDRSGTDRVVPALLWQLERASRAHRVTVVALAQEPGPAEWDLLGAHVVNIGGRLRRLRAARRLLADHRRVPFDVVHAFWGLGPGGAATVFAALTAVPLLVHLAGGELVALPDIGYGGALRGRHRRELRRVLRRAAAVTVASGAMHDQLRAAGRAAEVVPLGVDRRYWPAQPPRPRDPAVPLRLVHVASLNAVKDQALLVAVGARLAARGVRFTLDVVGEDTLGGMVQRAAAALGLRSVTWHGFLPQPQVRAIVHAAHVFVLTSRHEAGPVAVLEAALCGVPTVGTAVGHVADLAPDAALAVPGRDPEALADAIAQLANDEPRRLALARAAQAWAVAHDADRTFTQFDALYHRLASSRP